MTTKSGNDVQNGLTPVKATSMAVVAEAMRYNARTYGRADRLTAIHTARAACVGVAAMLAHVGR